MRYVILRDDDTNALTPPECLERLYRPFLERGLPVNLAVIPSVDLHTRMAGGALEGYLFNRNGATGEWLPISANPALVAYLRANPGFQVAQHGCHHDHLEFAQLSHDEAAARIDHGLKTLAEAGFSKPSAFVAPYDKFSRASLAAVAERFDVVSSGWFEARRLPPAWWPQYALKKFRCADHWRVGGAWLLSHPGCFLSFHRPRHEILDAVKHWVETHRLTVLVTHWWEYFPDGKPDGPFIDVLHQVADYLAHQPDLKTISFAEAANVCAGSSLGR